MLLAAGADADMVDDLVQETFLRAFRSIDSLDRSRPVLPWLWIIAKRVRIDALRRADVRLERVHPNLSDLPRVPTVMGPEERVVSSEDFGVLRRAVAQLSGRHRRLLFLRHIEGWSYEEIAELEGIPLETMRSALARARRRLVQCYEHQREVLVPVIAAMVGLVRRAGRRGNGVGRFWGDGAMGAAALRLAEVAVAVTVLVGASPGRLPAAPEYDPPSAPITHPVHVQYAEPTSSAPGDSPGSSSPTGSEEPLAGGLAGPTWNAHEPEQTSVVSMTASPNYEEDRTVFAVGRPFCVASACPNVLLRSIDGGASWVTIPSLGFLADVVLLPDGFGRTDRRIFAAGPGGLLVSHDGGLRFTPIGAVPSRPVAYGAVTGVATISPLFGKGHPKIVVGGSGLSEYRDDNATTTPLLHVREGLLAGGARRYSPAFAVDVGEQKLFVGTTSSLGTRRDVPTILVCTEDGCGRRVLTEADEAPVPRPAPDFAQSRLVYAFAGRALWESTDGGESFSLTPTPWSPSGTISDVQSSAAGLYVVIGWTDTGVWFKPRGGQWRRLDDGWLLKNRPRLLEVAGDRLLVSFFAGGLACSPDGGATWAPRCPHAVG